MSRIRLFYALAAPLAASLAALVLAGCSGGNIFGGASGETRSSTVEPSAARQLAVGDEPFAVNAAVAVLGQGGNAVDAASAMFFALSVTWPVAAGPGGGGLCIVRDSSGGLTEFDFLPRGANRGGAYAVPTAVRGFFEMQKRLGSLPWQRTVSPGEALADAGFPISQALAARLGGTLGVVRLDAALAAEFLDESGNLKQAGTVVSNPALAHTLSVIRQEGADGFSGTVGARMIAYAGANGGVLGADDFAAARPRVTAPARRVLGQLSVAYPAAGTGAGAFSAALLSRIAGATPANAGASAVAAVRQVLSSFGVTSIPADFGSTGFAVFDGTGGAAACAVTLNGPFGTGRTAGDTGVLLAAAPSGPSGLASAFLMPLLATGGDDAIFVGAAAGGPNGDAAMVSALMRMAGGASIAAAGDIQTTGNAPRDTINLIACRTACVALADPGAAGLGGFVRPVLAASQ